MDGQLGMFYLMKNIIQQTLFLNCFTKDSIILIERNPSFMGIFTHFITILVA